VIPLRVEDTMLFEDFGDDWNCGVYRVGNHKNESLGAGLGNLCGEIANDTGVDLVNSRVSIEVNTRKGE
jgi:hypothetical protein